MIRRFPRRRLARRLLAAQALVIAAGAVTLAVVALLVSPPLFHTHIRRALGPVTDTVGRHLDEAFLSSLLLSLGIGITASVGAALVVSWVLSSRIARPIEDLSVAADRIAAGELSSRAARQRADDELADLTDGFNDMAEALEHTEDTRRRLLADLAHELRTPLATIEGYLEGLADGVLEPDEETQAALRDATSRLTRLVDDVALVSRAEEGQLDLEREQVAPRRIIETALAAFGDVQRADGVQLVSEMASDLPEIYVDPHRIQQVLANLLDNALRHTREGRITVTAHAVADALVIDVTDSGDGIEPEHLPHLFERFYRAEASRRSATGSGIGLTIARAIARAHGGDVTARSSGRGRGSTFTVRLPADSQAAPDPTLVQHRRRAPA